MSICVPTRNRAASLRESLTSICAQDYSPIEIVISILIPYSVYLAAELVHASGVMAVVACGLYLSRQSSQLFSASVRLQTWAVWDSMTFAINGLVFVLIGLQLPYVLAGIREYGVRQLVLYGVLFSVVVIVLRLLWMYPGAYFAYFMFNKTSMTIDNGAIYTVDRP